MSWASSTAQELGVEHAPSAARLFADLRSLGLRYDTIDG